MSTEDKQNGVVGQAEDSFGGYSMSGSGSAPRVGTVSILNSEEQAAQSTAKRYGVEFVRLAEMDLLPHVVGLLPQWLVHQDSVIAVRYDNDTLYVAMVNPVDAPVLDKINLVTGLPVKPVVATLRDIQRAIRRHYGAEQLTRQDRMDAWFDQTTDSAELETSRDLVVSEDDGQIVRLVNSILKDAIDTESSDIHFEPANQDMLVRLRTDGILRDCLTVPGAMRKEVTTRLKVLAKMDITEKRKAQDGHVPIRYSGKDYDLRVSVLPTIDGEKVVVRILDKSRLVTNLESLGLDGPELRIARSCLNRPNGIILVTGPTGSGKTTTLYAMLQSINAIEKNVVTVENPVEYRLDRINQIQVDAEGNVTFAHVLRSILRQDPDIIMVGEIRDLETAEIAIQAALTGHLVLSTLHTNDAATAITRLRELGVPSYLLASCVTMTMAQRLVRSLCPDCLASYKPDPELLTSLNLPLNPRGEYMHGEGCEYCQNTGYRGRQPVFEILPVDTKIQEAILADASAHELKAQAVTHGMRTLQAAALAKVEQGQTTPTEVQRVIAMEALS